MENRVYKLGETCALDLLRVGQSGKLISFDNQDKALRRRLLDMGLTKGVNITIKMISPLGDPIGIELRGYQLCLRKNDLQNILVEVTSDYVDKKNIKGGNKND